MRFIHTTSIIGVGVLLTIGGGVRPAGISRAEDPGPQPTVPAAAAASDAPAAPRAQAPAVTGAEQAERVRRFVGEHQPELAALLDRLENRKPDDHAAALADLDRSVLALMASKAKDEQLYAIELRAWQARTRIDLLVARWMAGTKKTRANLEPEIRTAIAAEIDARAAQLAYRKQRSASWYDRQIERMRDKRDELVAERLESLLAEPGRRRKPGTGESR